MPVRGTLKADGIAVGRIEIDYLTNPPKVKTLAGLTVESTGQTIGWVDSGASMWSAETLQRLKELKQSMENDLGRALFMSEGAAEMPSRPTGVIPSGLGEHLGEGVPSV